MLRIHDIGSYLIAGIALMGCEGGGPDLTVNNAEITLSITDAAVDDATAVWVEFSGIEFKPSSKNSFTINFDNAKKINLLALQGSEFQFLLDKNSIDSGNYSWMRLKVNALQNTIDSYIVPSAGGNHSLYIPSGSETGLKLNQKFTIPTNGLIDLTIDFDLRKSIVAPSQQGDDYKLKPSLRLLQTNNTGHISGSISNTTMSDAACIGTSYAVYAYEGKDITPDDIDATGVEPVTASLVTYNGLSSKYEYTLGFLDKGEYTISFTCEASSDLPESSEILNYIGTTNITVTSGETTIYDFQIMLPE